MDMPPSRYRVVEQGRRLVVIDTLAGRSVTPPAIASRPEMPSDRPRTMEAPRPQPQRRPPPGKPEPRGRYAGGEGFSFETARWFDNEGPRTIRIGKDSQTQLLAVLVVVLGLGFVLAMLLGWVLAFPVAFVIFHEKTRIALRAAATTWLTALNANEG